MAKPNYSFAKRQREIAKKQKKDSKRQQKAEAQLEPGQDDSVQDDSALPATSETTGE